MIRILFVCHGNICRSPMAEFIMRELAFQVGRSRDFLIASAATSAEEVGNGVYPPARRRLAQEGIDCTGKLARQLTAADYEKYDLIIGMDGPNLRHMRKLFDGDKLGKCHLLLDYTSRPGDIADPWYTGDFDRAWEDILAGCQGLLAQL